jgi:hypothetical protein
MRTGGHNGLRRAGDPLGGYRKRLCSVPVLDADLRLAPAGEQLTILTLTGSYRPPFGRAGEALDRVVMHRVASATVRNFLASMAVVLTRQVTKSSPSSSNS